MLASRIEAQPNLVPNSSFEQYSGCPSGAMQIDSATPWFQPNLHGSSTDYYNACSSNNQSSVPNNVIGFQPAKTGMAYVGICTRFTPGFENREYLEVELIDSLIQGETYCISFFVSKGNFLIYASDRLGAYLSVNPVLYNNPSQLLLNYIPQVENPIGSLLSDTINWMLISGIYLSNGGERYLTIGNFSNDSNTQFALVNPSGTIQFAYYYIDDVSVIHGSCSTGINANSRQEEPLILSPNPAREKVTISIKSDEKISIFSIEGRLLLEDFVNSTVDVSEWDEGIYIVRATAKDGRLRVGKLIVAR